MAYYLPATIALVIKIVLIYYARTSITENKVNTTLFTVLILLTICNVLELLGVARSSDPASVEVFLRIYYVSLVLLFVFLCQLSFMVVSQSTHATLEILNYVVGFLICVLLLFTDLIIAGIESIGYSVTRIAGPFYSIFQLHAITMLIAAISIVIYGIRTSSDRFKKIQAIYFLIGIIFLGLPVIVAIALMSMGWKINASLILPVGISLFLITIVYAIKSHNIFDIRIWMPFTATYRLNKLIFEEYQLAEDGSEPSAADRRRNHEQIYLLRLLIDYENNQAAVARVLGVSESTISKKRREYNI